MASVAHNSFASGALTLEAGNGDQPSHHSIHSPTSTGILINDGLLQDPAQAGSPLRTPLSAQPRLTPWKVSNATLDALKEWTAKMN